MDCGWSDYVAGGNINFHRTVNLSILRTKMYTEVVVGIFFTNRLNALMDTLTGDITFLRSKRKSNENKVDYLFLNISECYVTIFDLMTTTVSESIDIPIHRFDSLSGISYGLPDHGEQLFDTDNIL